MHIYWSWYKPFVSLSAHMLRYSLLPDLCPGVSIIPDVNLKSGETYQTYRPIPFSEPKCNFISKIFY